MSLNIEKEMKEKEFLWHDYFKERFEKDCIACPAREQSKTCKVTFRECRMDDCFAQYWMKK